MASWYKMDLAEATALALAIFKAEETFVEVIGGHSRPRVSGPPARCAFLRSVENPNGEEAHS